MEKQNRVLGRPYESPEAEGIFLVPFDDFVQYGNKFGGDNPLIEDIEKVENGDW